MKNMNPQFISPKEWEQIIAVPAVREAWGLEDDVSPGEFAGSVYAAKFDFVSGSPGYIGDLYILQGDALTGYFSRRLGTVRFRCDGGCQFRDSTPTVSNSHF
jgi:hypothetical protein